MKIKLISEGGIVTASLHDNPTAKAFYAQLPLTLDLEDYAATEKIAYIPERLPTDAAPDGMQPHRGDITYYAPWGNLAIFYKDFRYAAGLVGLGSIDSGMDILKYLPDSKVTIERT